MLLAEQFDHVPKTREINKAIERLGVSPKNLLTDNGPQFKREWKNWCKWRGITPLFAHPYYPQDKGKVERTIRTVAEEFINLIVKFPHWINGLIKEYLKWYNEKRFHRGIKDYPANLYSGSLES